MKVRENWLERINAIKSGDLIPVIAEIKPSSPSAGDLLKGRALSDIVQAYESGGAACISVVTGKWFGGDISLLSEVSRLTSLPLLRKDLIVNKKQLEESKKHGANAVLLTKKILRKSHLEKLINECVGLNITPFIEVSDINEIEELPTNKNIIVAITNRDIAQKEMDTQSGLNSLNLISKVRIGAGAIISASGISSPEEANLLVDAGFDGLLIGTALLSAKNPQLMIQTLSQKTTNAVQ